MPDLPLRPVEAGYHASTSNPVDGVWVVRTAEELHTLWRRAMSTHRPEPVPPPVDWATEMAVLFVLGVRGTGGYVARVERVRADDGVLRVFVLEERPGAGVGTTQALSNPFHLVAVPRTEDRLTVEVVTRVEVVDWE